MKHYKKVLEELITFKINSITEPTLKDYFDIKELIQFSSDMRLNTEFIVDIKKKFAKSITFYNKVNIKEI